MTRTARMGLLAGLTMTILGVAGCATAPVPTSELAAAEAAFEAAQAARASDFAPVELGFANEKLQAARAAMSDRQNDRARASALQALVDAELALAKSHAAQVRAELQEKTAANAQLRSELLGEEGGP